MKTISPGQLAGGFPTVQVPEAGEHANAQTDTNGGGIEELCISPLAQRTDLLLEAAARLFEWDKGKTNTQAVARDRYGVVVDPHFGRVFVVGRARAAFGDSFTEYRVLQTLEYRSTIAGSTQLFARAFRNAATDGRGTVVLSTDGGVRTYSGPTLSYFDISLPSQYPAVVWAGQLFVAICSNGETHTSTNGLVWTQRAPAGAGGAQGPGANRSGVVISSEWDTGGCRSRRSLDHGVTWNDIAMPAGDPWGQITYLASTDTWYALRETTGTEYVKSSDNGDTWTTWTPNMASFDDGGQLVKLAATRHVLLGLHDDCRVVASMDGESFQYIGDAGTDLVSPIPVAIDVHAGFPVALCESADGESWRVSAPSWRGL